MTPPAGTERSPLERAVDLLLHAPLGVMVTARDELPRLIAKGRQEATGARFIGKMAVGMGQREAGKLLRQATERLADLGLVPDPRRSPAGPTHPPSEEQVAATVPAPPPPPSSPSTQPPEAPTDAAGPAAAGSGPPAASLAIPGYDSLSAPQVVQRLDGLSADELESVRAYEMATRGRKTILSRVAQIQSVS